MSGKTLPEFSRSLRISRYSLINYQKNRTSPDSRTLSTLCEIYKVNPTWILLGEGELFIGQEGRVGERGGEEVNIDPVEQLLREEEEVAGIILAPEQRAAILKILKEFVYRDLRSIRELIRSIQRGKKEETEQ